MQTEDPARWGRWAQAPHVTILPQGRRERLFLIPISPNVVPGLKLAQMAAWMVLATLDAEAQMSGLAGRGPTSRSPERKAR